MFQKLTEEFLKFSRKNGWVFAVFLIALFFIYTTDSGSIIEVSLVFLVYFVADLCIMMMIQLMGEDEYKMASIFQLIWNIIFTLLFLYHFFFNWQWQYLLGSIGFLLWVYKNITLYHYQKDTTWINNITLIIWNIVIFGWAYFIFEPTLTGQLILQTLWITLFTGCLVMKDTYPRIRYFQWFFWLSFLVLGSGYWIYLEYMQGSIYGVTISYFLMPLTVLLVYTWSFKKYL